MSTSAKHIHEFLDPIHGFIHLSSDERQVIDSPPFQRLRHIHQLGLTYLVYPGATHRRFEHSLGVMELAGRVFDRITDHRNLSDDIRAALPPLDDQPEYWRQTLRMAALCHDLGHPPFSHATEALFPDNVNHEDLTRQIIHHDSLRDIWTRLEIEPAHIARLALGPEKITHPPFTPWETILSEIITGDIFGVDRMDYLLRDSHHLGVTYGQFDYDRVIESLRLMIPPSSLSPTPGPKEEDYKPAPALGVEKGGLGATEGMALARYFMYSQVYMHPVCRIYEKHLHDFMESHLEGGGYSDKVVTMLETTDNDIGAAIALAAVTPQKPGHEAARIIATRGHYRLLDEGDAPPIGGKMPKSQSMKECFDAMCAAYGKENFKHDSCREKTSREFFFVRKKNDAIVSAYNESRIFKHLPQTSFDRIYVAPSTWDKARDWIKNYRQNKR